MSRINKIIESENERDFMIKKEKRKPLFLELDDFNKDDNMTEFYDIINNNQIKKILKHSNIIIPVFC